MKGTWTSAAKIDSGLASFEISFLLNSSENRSFDKLQNLIQDYLLSL